MALNKNQEIKKLHTTEDHFSDVVTRSAGSVPFLLWNVIFIAVWLLINTGQLGDDLIFDPYPFGLLTNIVSVLTILLSIFVLITQNRQSKMAQLRAELDYRIDLQSEVDIEILVTMLERLARKQGVEVSDLARDLRSRRAKVLRDNPLSK